MKKHLRYLRYVILHKWYVFRAGRKLGGIPFWRLIIHDYSKFSKAEWTPYVNKFFNKGFKPSDPDEFSRAWNHHLHNNPHHWEFWINPATNKVLDMPTYFVREMVADWLGAGRGITGSWRSEERR